MVILSQNVIHLQHVLTNSGYLPVSPYIRCLGDLELTPINISELKGELFQDTLDLMTDPKSRRIKQALAESQIVCKQNTLGQTDRPEQFHYCRNSFFYQIRKVIESIGKRQSTR